MSNDFNEFNRNLIADLRANGGKPTSGPFLGRPVLILTTQGARSGEARENPLVYTRDGDRLVVIASKGGAPTHPAWYHNLRSNPEVVVEVLGDRFSARAESLDEGDEYERLYGAQAEVMPAFNEYRTKTDRKIPVVVLEKVAG